MSTCWREKHIKYRCYKQVPDLLLTSDASMFGMHALKFDNRTAPACITKGLLK
jgi:hypothetical protein